MRGGAYVDSREYAVAPQLWLPLDTTAAGVELIHWLTLLGVGYEDGALHVQLRYPDLFGSRRRYYFGDPVLIHNDGTVLKPASEVRDGRFYPGEIMYCGYHEQRFYVGDIENLSNLRLAWSGSYAEHVIDGDWSVDIDISAVGGSISESVDISGYPEFTGLSFRLSPMYFETTLETTMEFPDVFPLDTQERVMVWMDFRREIEEIAYGRELAIILVDGTRIEPERGQIFEVRRPNLGGVVYHPALLAGRTSVSSWHILDGSFDMDDVAEVVLYGVRFITE